MPPVTGLSGLGAALADVGADHLGRTRQLQDESRRRTIQLEDVQMARADGDRRYDRARADQLSDVREGRTREDAVYDRRRADQLADVEDNRVYAESLAFLENARKLKERLPFEQNLQRSVDEAASQLRTVRQRMDEVSRTVTSQPPAIGPNDPSVLALAQQLAGGSRKREEIAVMVPKALEQLQTEMFIKHSNSVKAANEVLQTLRATEAQLTDIIQAGIQARVAPNTPPPSSAAGPSALMSPSPAQPMRTVGAADLTAALDQALGRSTGSVTSPTPPPPSGGGMLENPTNNAVISAGNAALKTQANDQARLALNLAVSEGEAITRQLQSLAVPSAPSAGTTLATDGLYLIGNDPMVAAQTATSLLKRKAESDAKIQRLRAQLQGPLPASVTPPAINTPATSTPAAAGAAPQWWQTAQPAPAL